MRHLQKLDFFKLCDSNDENRRETGNLDVVMKGLAAYYEREENTMQDIKNAISYPLMILCMLLAIMLVMVVKVVPYLIRCMSSLERRLLGQVPFF